MTTADVYGAITGRVSVRGSVSAPLRPPVNTFPPIVTGSATIGSGLACSTGDWDNSPSHFAYIWRSNSTVVQSGDEAVYTVAATDLGANIQCRVVATNDDGQGNADSNFVGPVASDQPVNTALPSISGTVQVGQVLLCSTGTWLNDPASFAFQWRRSGTVLPGETNATYTVTSADVGFTLDCIVTAASAAGGATATAPATAVVQGLPTAPVNTAPPTVSGTTKVGQVLTATTGTWANTPSGYTYQWLRDGSNISGATSSTYTLQSADVNTRTSVKVTATNTAGSTAATSAQTALVTANSLVGGARFVALGDSITRGLGMMPWWVWADVYSSGRISTVSGTYNQGNSGDTSAQILARVPQVTAQSPDFVFVMGGVNDMISIPASTTISNLRSMYDGIIAAGAFPVAVCILPNINDTVQARLDKRNQINTWIKSQPDILAVEVTGFDYTLHTYDNLHPNFSGSLLIGQTVGAAIQTFIGAYDVFSAPSVVEATTYFNGNSGGLATGWSYTISTAGIGTTVTPSKTTVGAYTAQALRIVGGTNVNTVNISGPAIGATHTAGQQVDVFIQYSIVGTGMFSGDPLNTGDRYFSNGTLSGSTTGIIRRTYAPSTAGSTVSPVFGQFTVAPGADFTITMWRAGTLAR